MPDAVAVGERVGGRRGGRRRCRAGRRCRWTPRPGAARSSRRRRTCRRRRGAGPGGGGVLVRERQVDGGRGGRRGGGGAAGAAGRSGGVAAAGDSSDERAQASPPATGPRAGGRGGRAPWVSSRAVADASRHDARGACYQRRTSVRNRCSRVAAGSAGQARVHGRRPDDRRRGRHQPVEPLGGGRAAIGPASASPAAMPSMVARWARTISGSQSGAMATRSALVELASERRGTASARHIRTMPALKASPRSTRGITRTMAYSNGLRPRSVRRLGHARPPPRTRRGPCRRVAR